jgi:hypothetical protein
MSETITQYEVDERQVAKLEIYDKIEEILEYESIDSLPPKAVLRMVQTFIKYMDDTDDEV